MISTLKIQIVTIANVRVSCAFVLQCGIGRSPLGSSHSSLRTSRALCANICPLWWSTGHFSSPPRTNSLHQTSDQQDMTHRYIAPLVVGLIVLACQSKSKFQLCGKVYNINDIDEMLSSFMRI